MLSARFSRPPVALPASGRASRACFRHPLHPLLALLIPVTANTRDGNSERANTRDGHAVTGINTRDEDTMHEGTGEGGGE